MTSSASISTQSATGRPSTRTLRPSSRLIRSASFWAIDATWRVERPAGDHHMVGDVGFAAERDGDDVERLVVVEGTKHEAVQRLGLFDRLRP